MLHGYDYDGHDPQPLKLGSSKRMSPIILSSLAVQRFFCRRGRNRDLISPFDLSLRALSATTFSRNLLLQYSFLASSLGVLVDTNLRTRVGLAEVAQVARQCYIRRARSSFARSTITISAANITSAAESVFAHDDFDERLEDGYA